MKYLMQKLKFESISWPDSTLNVKICTSFLWVDQESILQDQALLQNIHQHHCKLLHLNWTFCSIGYLLLIILVKYVIVPQRDNSRIKSLLQSKWLIVFFGVVTTCVLGYFCFGISGSIVRICIVTIIFYNIPVLCAIFCNIQ